MNNSKLLLLMIVLFAGCKSANKTEVYNYNPILRDTINRLTGGTFDTINYRNQFKFKVNSDKITNSMYWMALSSDFEYLNDSLIKQSYLRYWETYSKNDSICVNSMNVNLDTNNVYYVDIMNFEYYACNDKSQTQIRYPDPITGARKCVKINIILRKRLDEMKLKPILESFKSVTKWDEPNSNENEVKTNFFRTIHFIEEDTSHYYTNSDYVEENTKLENAIKELKMIANK